MQHIGNQVKKIREHRNISQERAAQEIDIKQSAYSKRERGSIDFAAHEIPILAKLFDVPLENMYSGTIPETILLSEPEAQYGNESSSMHEVNGRFLIAMRKYMADHKIETLVDMAAKMNVAQGHLISISSGHKNVSFAILSKAISNCHFNGNYILTGKEIKSDEVNTLRRQVTELTRDKENLQLLVDQLRPASAQQTG